MSIAIRKGNDFMKKTLRWIALGLAAAMLCAVFCIAASAFTDSRERFKRLKDVKNDWAYESIRFVVETGVMTGTSNTAFEPQKTLTRAEFVQILKKIAEELGLDVSYTKRTDFSDCKRGEWYYDAVMWGAEQELVAGYSDGSFGISDSVTREQMCAFLYRFLQKVCGMDYSGTAVGVFTDQNTISKYAVEATGVMNTIGLLAGYEDGSFRPKGIATRKEAASIAERLIRYYLQTPRCFTGTELSLVWADDFDGTELDTDTWFDYGGWAPIDGGNTDQYHRDHIKLDGNGNLVMNIEYYDNSVLNPESEGFISSQNICAIGIQTDLLDAPFGYYECRAKIGNAAGVNCAFWMKAWNPETSFAAKDQTPSSQCSEIDIIETEYGAKGNGKRHKIASTLHWDQHSEPHNTLQGYYYANDRLTRSGDYIPVNFFDGEYHTYGCLWTKDEYVFYYDGYEIFRTDGTRADDPLADGTCQQPAQIILSNHFMDPNWYGISQPEQYPFDFVVDYVHVYQLNDYLEEFGQTPIR